MSVILFNLRQEEEERGEERREIAQQSNHSFVCCLLYVCTLWEPAQLAQYHTAIVRIKSVLLLLCLTSVPLTFVVHHRNLKTGYFNRLEKPSAVDYLHKLRGRKFLLVNLLTLLKTPQRCVNAQLILWIGTQSWRKRNQIKL